ncbi:MAG: PhoH family protein [Thermoanaerobaculales bacterium]|nr:PhoH family protein [Thermoanaerobaculales bacterium]
MRFEAQPEADFVGSYSPEPVVHSNGPDNAAAPALSGTLYVPDTSALIENPDSLDRLLTGGNVVVLMHQVVEELGGLQASRSKSEGVRHAARQVMRKLLEFRNSGQIHQGIDRVLSGEAAAEDFDPTPAGGVLAWEPDVEMMSPYERETGDNVILAGARCLANQVALGLSDLREVVVISEDSNLLLKCDAVDLLAENLRYGKVTLDRVEQVFRGVEEHEVDEEVMRCFADSAAPGERWVPFDAVPGLTDREVPWNLGVVLRCEDSIIVTRADSGVSQLKDLRFGQYWDRKREVYRPRPILGFAPRDPYQVLAMEFLLDPTVQLVVVDGPAGSGKTRMMVAAALYMLIGQPIKWRVSPQSESLSPEYGYDNGLLLLRPEHASSQYELGFLPGDYETKLSPWLEPFFQAMRSLSFGNEHDFVSELQDSDRLTMLSTSMLRGLDIERSIVLVDELQNGDRHLAKTLMSRFCASSKVVLAGCLDPVQIDNPYVDWRSNALTRVKETYKGFGKEVAQVRLAYNYRGPISTKADEL